MLLATGVASPLGLQWAFQCPGDVWRPSVTAYAAFLAAFSFAQRFFAPAIILAFASGLMILLAFFAAGAVAGAGAGDEPVLPFNFAHRA